MNMHNDMVAWTSKTKPTITSCAHQKTNNRNRNRSGLLSFFSFSLSLGDGLLFFLLGCAGLWVLFLFHYFSKVLLDKNTGSMVGEERWKVAEAERSDRRYLYEHYLFFV